MDYLKLKKLCFAEENEAFQGWDFSHLEGRWHHDLLAWDYDKIVRGFLKNDNTLLDMGTGGGEYLLTLNHPYHLTYATEGFLPNYLLCQKKLTPLGIIVKQVFDDDRLPFEDEMFDIVINRHESFNIKEVKRILKRNGIFITQQVGSENDCELIKALFPDMAKPFPNHTLANNVDIVKDFGFDILNQYEDFPRMRFFDIGAIIYLAKACVWEFPDFSVEKCFSNLSELQEQIESKGFFENGEHRFLIVARKPNLLS